MRFVYVLWYRNNYLDPEDKDYEAAHLLQVDADSAERALQWGDHVVSLDIEAHGSSFVRSHVVPASDPMYCEHLEEMPLIFDGRLPEQDIWLA